MRISPLGIFCANSDLETTSELAQKDASLTHPHPICLLANALFTMAIAKSISRLKSPQEIYEDTYCWATEMNVEKPLMKAILDAAHAAPADYVDQLGWVLIAFQNALWQLLNASSLEEGVIDTVMCGGDTDTNAAIAGALLGAVYGRNALPKQRIEKIPYGWRAPRTPASSGVFLAGRCHSTRKELACRTVFLRNNGL